MLESVNGCNGSGKTLFIFSLLYLLLPTMLSLCKEIKSKAFEIWKVLKSDYCKI